MAEQETQSSKPAAARKADRYVKIGFAAVVLIAGIIIWRVQRSEPTPAGWGTDLTAALEQAKGDNARVLVMVTARPMSMMDQRMIKEVINHADTRNALQREKFALVHLRQGEEAAGRFEYKETPAFFVLDAAGKVTKQQSGFMNILTFGNNFLGINLYPDQN